MVARRQSQNCISLRSRSRSSPDQQRKDLTLVWQRNHRSNCSEAHIWEVQSPKTKSFHNWLQSANGVRHIQVFHNCTVNPSTRKRISITSFFTWNQPCRTCYTCFSLDVRKTTSHIYTQLTKALKSYTAVRVTFRVKWEIHENSCSSSRFLPALLPFWKIVPERALIWDGKTMQSVCYFLNVQVEQFSSLHVF